MSERHCATPGCPGTLPLGAGTHCPRCGGTNFLEAPKKSGRWMLWMVMLVPVVVVLMLWSVRGGRQTSTASPGRQALVQAHDVAARMTVAATRDEAYGEVIRRALAQNDYEYACQVGGEMTLAPLKDKSLLEIVEEALKARQTDWATRAADEMQVATNRDAALKRIMELTGTK